MRAKNHEKIICHRILGSESAKRLLVDCWSPNAEEVTFDLTKLWHYGQWWSRLVKLDWCQRCFPLRSFLRELRWGHHYLFAQRGRIHCEIANYDFICSNYFWKEYITGAWWAVDSWGSAKNPAWRIHSASKIFFEITNVKEDELYVYEVQLVICEGRRTICLWGPTGNFWRKTNYVFMRSNW